MKKQRNIKVGLGLLVCIVLCMGYVFSDPLTNDLFDTPADSPATTTDTDDKPTQASRGYVHSVDEHADDTPWTATSISAETFALTSQRISDTTRPLARKQSTIINDVVYPLHTYRTLLTPNDPLANQWWTQQATVASAWDVPSGGTQTVLAIIDTGFGLAHEDFSGRWFNNSGETGPALSEGPSRLNCTDRGQVLDYGCNLVDDDVDGVVDNETGITTYENPSRLNCSEQGLALVKTCNQLDDDKNGYIDDWRGWDAINQDNSAQAGEINPSGSSTTHGTMVAGVAAATGNNGVGIAGVNWHTKLMPLQAIDDDGYGNTRSVGQAIFYAVENGANVINISLGTDFHDPYVNKAVEAATAAGVTVVASSGNDGCECVVYPARYPEVVAVGALTSEGSVASFSSWGPSIDIAAPGVNMTVPSWSATNPTSRYVGGAAGTSFSAPLVAGATAMIKSHRPVASPLHVIAALHETADRRHNAPIQLPNARYGYGLVDVNRLLQRMITPKHSQVSYVLSPVAVGNRSGAKYEQQSPYTVSDCMQNRTSLPLYELKAGSEVFFSISEVETRYAVLNGYSQDRFAYVCLGQPHDTYETVRSINIFREFKNLYIKP